jgi:hypothetical protein
MCQRDIRIAELETALAEARKDADYWEAENGRMLELCRTKLGKRDVHGVADGIGQLAEAREDSKRLATLFEKADVFRPGLIVIQLPLGAESQWDGVTALWDESKFRAAIDSARKERP